ncbi:MAG: hypothetical protein KJ749_07580 [Planctomycetes bacterium]|nr:hypothetical protein [Planctomycetota bacterium]
MNVPRVLSALVATIIAIIMVGTTRAEESEEQVQGKVAQDRQLDIGKSMVRDRPASDFVDVTFELLPKDVKSQMYTWLEFTMQREVDPQRRASALEAGDFRVRVFAAYEKPQHDLVEYRWKRFGQDLRLVASRNAMYLDIDLDELERDSELHEHGDELVDRARALVSKIIQLSGEDPAYDRRPFEIDLRWPDELTEGTEFSSNDEQSIMHLQGWYQRVDAYVKDGVLHILLYKKAPTAGGYFNATKWFPDDFRELVHRKAAEQGRVPSPAAP